MKFKVIKESKDTKVEVENPGLLEVPKGKKVYDLPVSHFKKLIDKKGRAAIMKGINNLAVWNKNDDPKIASWAKKMKKSLEGYGEKKTKNESLKESSLNEEHTMVREEEEELDNAIKEAIHQTRIVSQTHEDRETRMIMRKVRELLKQARELY